MIERDLLRQLGWSADLINAVDKLAKPLREQQITTYEIGYATNNLSASNRIHAVNTIAYSTHALNIASKNK